MLIKLSIKVLFYSKYGAINEGKMYEQQYGTVMQPFIINGDMSSNCKTSHNLTHKHKNKMTTNFLFMVVLFIPPPVVK